MSKEYGLLIDYAYCTGCHSCEMACRSEHDWDTTKHGMRIFQDGPRELEPDVWEYNYMPMPTSLCDLCAERVEMGKLPTCVHHCQAACMYYGTIDELAAKMKENATQMVLYTLKNA